MQDLSSIEETFADLSMKITGLKLAAMNLTVICEDLHKQLHKEDPYRDADEVDLRIVSVRALLDTLHFDEDDES